MSNEPLPAEWQNEQKRIHTYRQLGDAMGVAAGTAHRLVNGGGTSDDTIQKAADLLFSGDRNRVRSLRGEAVRDYGLWVPEGGSLLEPEERDALATLVKTMIRNRRSVVGNVEQPAPMKPPVRETKRRAEAGAAKAKAKRPKVGESSRKQRPA